MVISDSLTSARWGHHTAAKILSDDCRSIITELKTSAKNNIVIWGSLSIVDMAMRERLVDEFHIHVCPMITGGGKRFPTGSSSVPLRLINTTSSQNGLVSLHYKT